VSGRGRISTNAAYQLGAQAGVLALNLVASPIIVHGLGLEAYGLLLLVGITTNYFGFVELGLGRATIQLLARHRARGEEAAIREVLWTAAAAYLALSLVGAVALVAAAPWLVKYLLAVSPRFVPQALRAFLIGAAGLVITMQRDVASSVATAMERFDLIGRVTLVVGFLQTAVNVGLVLWGAPLTGVMLGGLAVQTAALATYWAITFSLIPNLLPPRWNAERLRSLLRFGGYVTVSQVVGPLLVHSEKVLIGAFASVEQLPYYALPYNLAWALTAVPTSLVSVIYPAMVRLLSTQDHAGLRETVRRATRYIFVVLLGPVVLFFVYAREVLTVWMGGAFAANASGCLRILSIAVLVNVMAWPAYQLLHAAGRADLTARYHLLELVIHIPVSIVLIWRLGVLGAALAWLLRVLVDTGLLMRAAARVAGMPAQFLAGEIFGRGLLAALGLLPFVFASRRWLETGSRGQGAVFLAMIGLCYVPPVIWLGLGREERQTIIVAIRSLVARSKGSAGEH
jgi:O-antigen/teichoic acid export membrane protein